MRARRVFRLDGGHRYLRKALKARGWVEKFTNRTKRFQTGDEGDDPVDFTDDPIDDAEKPEVKDPNEIGSGSGVDEMDRLVSRALRRVFKLMLARWRSQPTERATANHIAASKLSV